jgi:hypothetical protein
MHKHQSRLPIILILITLLSVAGWAVAGASSRTSAWLLSGSRTGIGHATTFSGEPDTPAARGNDGGKATTGTSKRGISGDLRSYLTGATWIRMLEVRLFGQ